MNVKNTIRALSTYSNNASDIERMIVYAFIKKENIRYDNSNMLKDYDATLVMTDDGAKTLYSFDFGK